MIYINGLQRLVVLLEGGAALELDHGLVDTHLTVWLLKLSRLHGHMVDEM